MSHYSSMEEALKEMQLHSHATPSSSQNPPPPWPTPGTSTKHRSSSMDHHHHHNFEGPSLDLQLSISVTPIRKFKKYSHDHTVMKRSDSSSNCVEALKRQAAEQIRLAAMEKAYAEHLRELTRREMEMAQFEFARARSMWERAREEVERAEKMKERAMATGNSNMDSNSTCMEITCHSCRQKFIP